jgi:hypothetical protein
MDTKTLTPRELFDGTVCYEIPPFQRPYVWNEEDQWQPLWADIERVASAFENARDGQDEVSPHFLGAVVIKQLAAIAGDPARHSVIDGQQRLMTLQILLDAIQLMTQEYGDEDDAETLMELVANNARRFRSTPKRFKLWPSRSDRPAFECVMDNELEVSGRLSESRIAAAHDFFCRRVREWAGVEGKGGPSHVAGRLQLLSEVVQQQLVVVAINLEERDDDQLIFETLNDRGTPLLAADLIKNLIFQRGEELGVDVDAWGEKYWADFDDEWWRQEVKQGRLFRSRIDLFFLYWLTMSVQDMILAEKAFAQFRAYAAPYLASAEKATQLLVRLRRDADTFRGFAELDPSSVPGGFYARVVEGLGLGATIPLLLWLISDNHDLPAGVVDRALGAVESWCIRRTLLRATTKDVNTFIITLIKYLNNLPADQAGEGTVAFLLDQASDSRVWPTDDQVAEALRKSQLYGSIQQNRLCIVLSAVEQKRRTDRNEDVSLPANLQIEHVMPQKWRTYWSDGIDGDPSASGKRDRLVQTIGNLTLVTSRLNASLSNRPWLDSDAVAVAPGGPQAGMGKRSLIDKYSLLVLNKEIVQEHKDAWTEEDIMARSQAITNDIVAIWPRGLPIDVESAEAQYRCTYRRGLARSSTGGYGPTGSGGLAAPPEDRVVQSVRSSRWRSACPCRALPSRPVPRPGREQGPSLALGAGLEQPGPMACASGSPVACLAPDSARPGHSADSGDAGEHLPGARRQRRGLCPACPPCPCRGEPGWHDLQGGQRCADVPGRVVVQRRPAVPVRADEALRLLGVGVGADREDDVAARRQRGYVPVQHFLAFPDREEVQQRPHDEARGRRQVNATGDLGENLARITHIAVHRRDALVALLEQRPQVEHHDRVIVDVGHAGPRGDRLRGLLRAGRGRQPGPDVNELADPLPGHPRHGASEELLVLPDEIRRRRVQGEQPVRQLPVRGEIVLAAQPVVINPGDTRGSHVEFGHMPNPSLRRFPGGGERLLMTFMRPLPVPGRRNGVVMPMQPRP